MNSRERERPDWRTLRRGAGWLIEAGGLAILVTQAWRIA
jgi:hypothetical protein